MFITSLIEIKFITDRGFTAIHKEVTLIIIIACGIVSLCYVISQPYAVDYRLFVHIDATCTATDIDRPTSLSICL